MLLVVGLGDPGGIEGGEGGEGGGSLPDSELTVGRGDDLDLSAWWGFVGELGLQSVGETSVHGGTTREDNILAKVLSDVDVGSLNGVPGGVLEGIAGHTREAWLEKKLWAAHSDDSTDVDDSLVWKGVWLVVLRGGCGGL